MLFDVDVREGLPDNGYLCADLKEVEAVAKGQVTETSAGWWSRQRGHLSESM